MAPKQKVRRSEVGRIPRSYLLTGNRRAYIVWPMYSLRRWPRLRFVSLWVVLFLVGIAVAMALFALSDDETVAFVRSLALPGQPAPDTSRFDGTMLAVTEAIIASALGAALVVFPSRALFGISAVWALLALGTGAWTLLGTPQPLPANIGPMVLPMSFVGIALTLMVVACVTGCLVGWFTVPSEPVPEFSYMPPPTHQGG